ncbi:glycoside hydrolase family 3 C-terminal domain-containing protein [Streptomyces sp. NBC_01218]|uniref:glycoside hydrolase family 3 C-terminal domain-containing protein n=1 Tax=Streptomyces sp. NBC_01218 TaxID=2903780 RepID=UPI002E138CE0|nr:glycoside hydrolase family 3 C-terminal domain-containing protein [Streptomyces sp. NBC_01218]
MTVGPVAQPGTAAARAKAVELVARMTTDEKIALLHGVNVKEQVARPGYVGKVVGNERLGIPATILADGPSGVGNGSTGVTQWPCSKALAATWDPAAAETYGRAYGGEQAAKGHNVALGPCVNILRTPRWGRSFETFTEDPHLNAALAGPVVRGIQSHHVMATVKHFAANNQETLRHSIDAVVSSRALHEIYFPAFRAAVQEGGVGAVMTAYNKVNGVWTHENRTLVQDVLRDGWGFDGIVMSDWGGTHSTVRTAEAGSTTEMPGSTYFGAALASAVARGAVTERALDTMAVQVLTAMYRVGLFDHPLPDPLTVLDTVVSTEENRTLARRIGVEGSVLLKNTGGVLPFAAPGSVAVIGDAAGAGYRSHGGGSGSVNAYGGVVTPLAGITARAGSVPVTYARGTLGVGALPVVPAAALGTGLRAVYYASGDLTGTVLATTTTDRLDWTGAPPPVSGRTGAWSARYSGTYTASVAGRYRFSLGGGGAVVLTIDGAVVAEYATGAEVVQNGFVTLTEGPHSIEVTYRHTGGTPSLRVGHQPGQDRLIAEAAAVAAAAEVAVVVVVDVTAESMDRSTLALAADQDELIAAVAAANPRTVVVLNTSGAVLMPWLSSVPAVIANWYGGQEQGNAVAAMLFGDAEPGGRLPETFPATETQGPAKRQVEFPGDGKQVYYDEGLAVGYRWYQSSGEQPLFPFGHGLSYTSFALSGLRVERGASGHRATVRVRNTGSRAGSEVVQLYVTFPAAAGEPSAQLKAFAKVTLEPGRSTTVVLDVPRTSLAVWRSADDGWTVLPGSYAFAVGRSSVELPLRARVRVTR